MSICWKMNDRKLAYLLYDADCGPCTSFMKIVRLLDFDRKIVPLALGDKSSFELVQGKLTLEEMLRSFHLVRVLGSGKNQVLSAGEALLRLTEYFPLGRFVEPSLIRDGIFGRLACWIYLQATRLRTSSCETKI